MDEIRHKIVLRKVYLIYTLIAFVVYGLLMGFVFPWWHASNHPVVVTMGAGSAQAIELAFSDEEPPLKLAPIREEAGYLWHWATELPPRAKYQLAIVFPEGTVGEVILKDMEVVSLSPEKTSIHLDYESLVIPEDGSVRVQEIEEGHRIFAEPGGRLPLNMALPQPTPYEWFTAGAKASIGFVVVALVFMLMIGTFLRFPDGLKAYRKKTPPYEWIIILVFALAGSLAHVYLVRHSVPSFTPGTSERYLLAAISQHQNLSIEPGSSAHGLFPAYPFLIEKIAGLVGWDMRHVTFAQAVLFCFSVSMLSLGLTRIVQGYLVAPVTVLALLSPPAVFASRNIGIDSTFASAVLLALAAFLFLWERGKAIRWFGFFLFGLCTAWAVATSFAGLVLLILPLGLLTGTAWWCYSIRGSEFYKLPVFWRTLGQVAIPFAFFVMTCFLTNQVSRLGPRECVFSNNISNAPFVAGLFDVRGIEDAEQYAAFLNERDRSGYIAKLDAFPGHPEIARASLDLLPIRAVLVAWGRLSGWGLFLPEIRTFDQSPLVTKYNIPNGSRPSAEVERVREKISELMRQTGVAVHVMDRRSNKNIVLYNKSFVSIYPWFYRILFLAGLAAWLIGLWERKYLAAVLLMPYLLNILLQVFALQVTSHGIQSLDALLWFATLAGLLAANPKSMQKPTDESDRRCMPPIRPKRLLTRFKTVPGTKV